jgi:iron(III) transport system ATP-binding protein
MATSPGLLLLDEPLSALDAKVRVHLRHEVKDLQRRLGVTAIMVTHDQEEALTMADRIVVMNQGVIEQVGTPVEIYRSPATAFVADFIGTMNFVLGTVVGPDRVRLGQVDLNCDADGHAQGASVTIAVRPEDIVVQGVSEGEDNVFEVKVDAMEFLGSFFRADLADGAMGEARLRADFSINLVRRLGIDEGHSMNIKVPRECIRIYGRSAADG